MVLINNELAGTNPVSTEATKPRFGQALVIQYLQQIGILAGFIVLILAFAILSPYFLTLDNLLAIALQSAINAVIALGMTFVIATGGIDLSVGSIVALAGVIMADLMRSGVGVPVSMLAGTVIGVGCGTVNGLLITKAKLPPFIVTLGMMSFIRGSALIYTSGQPIYGVPAAFRFLGSGYIGAIPVPVIIAAVAAGLAYFLLRKTRFGEYTLAIGGNEEATRLSGVNVGFYKTLVYSFCGLMCTLGTIILVARLNAAEPIAGFNYELDAIAATVMGGTSLAGGQANILGTMVGALIMGALRNGLNLLNVQAFYQQLAIGAVIILAVLVDRFRK